MPKHHDEATWSGKKPSDVLASLLSLLPGTTSSQQASHAAPAATDKPGSMPTMAKNVQHYDHTVTVSLQGMEVIGQAEQAASEAGAEQAAALDALHKCVSSVCTMK